MQIKTLIQSVNIVVLFFLFYCVGKLLAVIIDIYFLPDNEISKTQLLAINTPEDNAQDKNYYADLILNNIFNTVEAPPGILDDETTTSDLDKVKLQGILVWTNQSLALLSYENNSSVVKVNENIPNTSIELLEVARSSVLLSSGGIEKWKDIENNIKVASSSNGRLSQNDDALLQRATQATGGIELLEPDGNTQNVLVSQQRLENELQNFASFLNQARVFPNFNDGKADGYVIRNIEPKSIYEQLGLKNEDIIKTINGQNIDSPERAFELFKLLRNEKFISISLLRAGSPLDLQFYIN